MRKKIYFLIFIGAIFSSSYGQYQIPFFTSSNVGGGIVSSDNSALLVTGQNAVGLTSDASHKVSLGLLAPLKMALTDVEIHKYGKFQLMQNYPNPFNTRTTIPFEISKESNVRITILNMIGQPVEIVTDRSFTAGKHLVEYNAHRLKQGIYFYQLSTGNYQTTKPMVCIR